MVRVGNIINDELLATGYLRLATCSFHKRNVELEKT